MMDDLYASYPFLGTDAFEHNGHYRIKFILPDGKNVVLDGNNPESVADAANEMYQKVRNKLREANTSLPNH